MQSCGASQAPHELSRANPSRTKHVECFIAECFRETGDVIAEEIDPSGLQLQFMGALLGIRSLEVTLLVSQRLEAGVLLWTKRRQTS